MELYCTQFTTRKRKHESRYRPMLATLVETAFDDKAWVFETKWDGFRLVTEKHDNTVRLWSRNGIDVTKRYQVLLRRFKRSRARVF